ncbi:MAG: DUF2934 domain-containing protein [Methylophilaceae bacterium]|nr:DUF2934 domain-containing protein [Methylophilaceae bacterium]
MSETNIETNSEAVTAAEEKKKAAPKKAAAAKKPAVAKKATAEKPEAEAKPATEKKPAAPRKPRVKKEATAAPDAETRYRMVEEAAYYIAEQHGFSGNSSDYWVAAEAQIKQLLGEK